MRKHTLHGPTLRQRWLTMLMILIIMASVTIMPVFAAGSVTAKDLYTCTDTGTTPSTSTSIAMPTWSQIQQQATTSPSTTGGYDSRQFQNHTKAVNIIDTFKTEAAFNKATAKLQTSVVYDGSKDELVPINNSTKGQQDMSRAVDSFNSQIGAVVADNTINGIFDTGSFNPSAGSWAPFLDTFYAVVNTIFYVVSNVVIWWFLAQTSFDMLYMICEPLRPIIGPSKGSSSSSFSSSQNANSYLNKGMNLLHICSSEVETACNSSPGGLGQNAGGKNQWFAYFKARAPVVIAVGAYLVLVSSGWWPKIISWVAGMVTRLLGMFIK